MLNSETRKTLASAQWDSYLDALPKSKFHSTKLTKENVSNQWFLTSVKLMKKSKAKSSTALNASSSHCWVQMAKSIDTDFRNMQKLRRKKWFRHWMVLITITWLHLNFWKSLTVNLPTGNNQPSENWRSYKQERFTHKKILQYSRVQSLRWQCTTFSPNTWARRPILEPITQNLTNQ